MIPRAALVLLAVFLAAGCAREEANPPPPADAPDTVAAAPLERAVGTEPFWSLTITPGAMEFRTPEGGWTAPAPRRESIDGGRRYVSSRDGEAIVATFVEQPCSDGMSDQTYPLTVTLVVGETTWRGCGGDPATLLHGAWTVVEVAGAPVVAGSPVTLTFAPDGQIAGSTGCNSYGGAYTVHGEGLRLGPVHATKRACEPAVMTVEGAFLGVLDQVRAFGLEADGTLVLSATDGRTIRARR